MKSLNSSSSFFGTWYPCSSVKFVVICSFCFTVPIEAPINVSVTANPSCGIMLTWERPPPEQDNGLLVHYHVIIIETQIQYFANGTELRGMDQFLNRTYNVSEGHTQLVDMLNPGYNYTVRIAAATQPGIGPFSDPITIMTCEYEFLYAYSS